MKNTMDEVETKDLQVWARENKIWRKESWEPFLENLEKLHSMLTEFWEFHKWLKGTFNNKRISLLPEELKNPARLIVAGGGRDDNAFARMMFNLFDVRVAGTKSYDESIAIYERRGDGIRISIGSKVLGTGEDRYKNILQDLKEVINHFKQQLEVSENFKTPEEDFKEWVNWEHPKLVEKLTEFLNLAVNMLEPMNPYVLFVRYFNVTSLGLLIDFLGCNTEEIKSLAELLEPYIYDNELNPQNVESIQEENIGDLFWILSPDGHPLLNSGKILSLFGEDGAIHELTRKLYPEVDKKFKELWKQRFTSLIKLMKSGRWVPPEELKVFFGEKEYQWWIKEICENKSYEILFIKSNHHNFVNGIGIDMLSDRRYPAEPLWVQEYESRWGYETREKELARYIYHYSPRLKTRYPVVILLEELFPLFATNYLQARVGRDSWSFGQYIAETYTFKFLAIRPTRCKGRYGKDSYLELIRALGELKNENQTND